MTALALLGAGACAAPMPLLARQRCEPAPAELTPATLVRCTEDGIAAQACLYSYSEPGIDCTWQLERQQCGGTWDLVAHSCAIHTPYETSEWELPVQVTP